MSVDDAILQMEMLGHDFYIFMNIETNKVSVVYLREDSNYGVIDTNY
jgi:putative sigma-54 modulation protein